MPAPWEKYQQTSSEPGPWDKFAPTESIHPAKTALRQGLQGLTYGLADEGAGVFGAAKDVLTGKAAPGDVLSRYAANRDEYRAADKASAEANPKTALFSEIAGGLLAPGGALRGLTAGKALTKVGLLGALNAAGSTEAETPIPIAKEALKGAALGGIGHGVGGVISKLIPNAVDTGNLAARSAIKHLRPTPTVAQALGPEELNKIGKTVNESGALKFGARIGDTAERINTAREQAGTKLGSLLDESGVTVNPSEIAQKIKTDVVEPLARRSSSGAKIAKGIEDQTDEFLAHHGFAKPGTQGPNPKNIPISALENEKTDLQGLINYVADPKAQSTAKKSLANAFRTSAEEALSKERPEMASKFKDLKSKYGNFKAAQKMSERTGGLTSGGTGLMGGLLDAGFGLEALREASQGTPEGVGKAGLIGLARVLTKGRGHSSVAATANAISKALSKRAKTNEALKLLEEGVTASGNVIGRQNAPYERR